jgi:hypothetical protein
MQSGVGVGVGVGPEFSRDMLASDLDVGDAARLVMISLASCGWPRAERFEPFHLFRWQTT